jgi:hypothetical protein
MKSVVSLICPADDRDLLAKGGRSMGIKKKTLWRVPLFCILAGVVSFNAIVFLAGRLITVRLPDGSVTADHTRVLILYGAIFVATVMLGGLVFFRNMTRKEIFFSASIVVAFGLATNLTQWALGLTTGRGAVFFLYASQIFEWSSVVPLLLYRLHQNLWLGACVGSLTPYLFIPFGKKGRG